MSRDVAIQGPEVAQLPDGLWSAWWPGQDPVFGDTRAEAVSRLPVLRVSCKPVYRTEPSGCVVASWPGIAIEGRGDNQKEALAALIAEDGRLSSDPDYEAQVQDAIDREATGWDRAFLSRDEFGESFADHARKGHPMRTGTWTGKSD